MNFQELKTHGTHDFPVELYHIDKSHPKYEMAFHWHNNIEIIRILDGSLSVHLNNKKYDAFSGDLIFVNSETIHGAHPDNCIYECIVFDGALIPSLSCGVKNFAEDLSVGQIRVNEYFPKADDELHTFANNLFDSMKEDNPGKFYKVLAMLCGIYSVILENNLYTEGSAEISEASLKLKKVLKYIRSTYEEPITLDDMSAAAGLSPKYFCAYFKKMTGKTPIDYLKIYRIEQASKMLVNTDDSITSIAFSSGFNDLSYFIKTFKSIKGISPNMFRKSHGPI